jgi:hypothetical protein
MAGSAAGLAFCADALETAASQQADTIALCPRRYRGIETPKVRRLGRTPLADLMYESPVSGLSFWPNRKLT